MTQKQYINELKNSIQELRTVVSELVNKVDELTAVVNNKDKTIIELEQKINNLEQFSKQNNIIISDPKLNFDLTQRNLAPSFITFAKEKLDIIIQPYDIVKIHKLKNNKNKHNKILVKLHHNSTKFEIIKNSKKLKGTDTYINEHLTQFNSDIFYKARQLRKDKVILHCWTINGITFIIKNEDSSPVKITDINKFSDI